MLAVLVTGVPKRFGLIHDGVILPVTWKGPLGVMCVGTRYGDIRLPTIVILFHQYIIRHIMFPNNVVIF